MDEGGRQKGEAEYDPRNMMLFFYCFNRSRIIAQAGKIWIECLFLKNNFDFAPDSYFEAWAV